MAGKSRIQRARELAAVARIITERVGRKRRAGARGWCYVPWRELDALADALRELGVDPRAPNLGAAAFGELMAKRAS